MRRESIGAALAALAILIAPATSHVAEARELEVAGRVEDLRTVRTRFLANDRSYSPEARLKAGVLLDHLEKRAADLSAAEFELGLARLVALANNGHTRVLSGERSRRYNRIGLRLAPMGNEFYVLAARPDHADLLGAKLVRIDGASLSRLTEEARALSGGVASFRDRSSPFLFESPQLLCAWGKAVSCDSAKYTFKTADGRSVSRSLNGEPPDATRSTVGSSKWLLPVSPVEAGGPWQSALIEECAPWSLQNPGEPFRWRNAPELEALIVDVRRNSGLPGRSLPEFLRSVEEAIDHHRPRNLILDFRLNVGGDLNLTRSFMANLPSRVAGRIFVLTSPWTFSAGIASLGYLEQAAPDRVTIVGESIGDNLRFYAEGGPVALKHSGAVLFNATELHDYGQGCQGDPICHSSIVRYPIRVRSLAPDVRAPWSARSYLEGRDPGMDAIRRQLGARSIPAVATCRKSASLRL